MSIDNEETEAKHKSEYIQKMWSQFDQDYHATIKPDKANRLKSESEYWTLGSDNQESQSND